MFFAIKKLGHIGPAIFKSEFTARKHMEYLYGSNSFAKVVQVDRDGNEIQVYRVICTNKLTEAWSNSNG